MRLENSVVVITGAASGIGRATALRFAREGAHVVLAARRGDALNTAAAECRAHGVTALAVPTDVSDPAAVDALARRAVEQFGRIDVWVNDASVTLFGGFLDVPLDDFRRVLDVNIMGHVYGARAALTQMRTQGSGVLINTSSIVAEVALPYAAAYSMSKVAIRALSVSLRSELALNKMSDIHVCTVLPPTVDTPIFQHAANYTGRAVRAMPPVYSPDRVARVIVNLARSPRNEATIGQQSRMMILQHKVAPAVMERAMATQVNTTHLSPVRPADDTTGNLYAPSTDPRYAASTGGWGGRTKTGLRRLMAASAVVGGAALVVRRQQNR